MSKDIADAFLAIVTSSPIEAFQYGVKLTVEKFLKTDSLTEQGKAVATTLLRQLGEAVRDVKKEN